MADTKIETKQLHQAIIKAIQDKKGYDIQSLNLDNIENAVAGYFIITHGTSRPQVEAIADAVMGNVKKVTGENPWHKEGLENAEWILIDYFNIVVHIFQEETRSFFQLEKLWADARIEHFDSEH